MLKFIDMYFIVETGIRCIALRFRLEPDQSCTRKFQFGLGLLFVGFFQIRRSFPVSLSVLSLSDSLRNSLLQLQLFLLP